VEVEQMAQTLTRTWFDQMASAVAELEMLRTVVSAEELVQSAPLSDEENLSTVRSWLRSTRDFLGEIEQAIT
jgi:hypothetical protein